MFCVNCGIAIEEKYNFCPKCGTEKVSYADGGGEGSSGGIILPEAEKRRNIVNNEKAMKLGKLGFNLFGAEQYEKALDCLNKSLEISEPDSDVTSVTLCLKSQVLEQLGKNEEGIDCMTRALEINQDLPDGWRIKGGMFFVLGNKISGSAPLAECSTMEYDQAKHRFEEALDCCNRALKTDPNNESALKLKNDVVKILRGEE